MTIAELHDRMKAAVKSMVGLPESQTLFRECWDNDKSKLLIRAIILATVEAGEEVCAFMNTPPGTWRNPRW